MQFGCEYLFGVTIDGRLNLRDAYVMDNETGVYAQPDIAPEVPYEPHHYQELPWSETFFGDSMMSKEPWEKVCLSLSYAALCCSLQSGGHFFHEGGGAVLSCKEPTAVTEHATCVLTKQNAIVLLCTVLCVAIAR